MRQLRSKASDLLELFSTEIKVVHIAERLQSLEASAALGVAQEFMEERDFDVIGVVQDDHLVGYVARHARGAPTCGEATLPLNSELLIADSTPLYALMPILTKRPWVFVLGRPGEFSIVTRGDLQKAPFRMLVAGIVTLLEMQMLRLVRAYFSGDSWRGLLSEGRLKKATDLYQERTNRNEQIDLADCLQFADKRDLLLRRQEFREKLSVSRRTGERLLRKVESLRDTIAHGQDLVESRNWDELFETIRYAHATLELLEGLPDRPAEPG